MVLRKAFEGLRRAVSVSRRTTLFAIRNLTDPIHSKNCAHVMGMWIDHVKQKDIEEEDDNDNEDENKELHHTRTVMLNTWRAWKSLLVSRWSWEAAQFTFMKKQVRKILHAHFEAWKNIRQENSSISCCNEYDNDDDDDDLYKSLDSQHVETHGTFSGLDTHLEDVEDLRCLERRIVQDEPLSEVQIRTLIESCDLNLPNNEMKRTALHEAALVGDVKTVR